MRTDFFTFIRTNAAWLATSAALVALITLAASLSDMRINTRQQREIERLRLELNAHNHAHGITNAAGATNPAAYRPIPAVTNRP